MTNGKKENKEETSQWNEEVMTRSELAEFLHVGYTTILTLERKKAIPHVKIGKRTFFLKSDIIKWLKQNTVAPVVSPHFQIRARRSTTKAEKPKNENPTNATKSIITEFSKIKRQY